MGLQPFFKVSEFDGSRLYKVAAGKPSHPVVMHAKGSGDFSLLPHSLPDLFSGRLDSGLNLFCHFLPFMC